MSMHMKNMIDEFLGKLPKQRSTVAANVKADLLLVNCIDCRYPQAVHNFMHERYAGKVYDHLVLAGASLASTEIHTHNSAWSQTFLEHVKLSIDLHEIDGVLVLDHRTCGAFLEFGLLTAADHNLPREFDQHEMVAKDSATLIGSVFKQKPRQGHIAFYLTPEIPVGSSSFPSEPKRLHAIDV